MSSTASLGVPLHLPRARRRHGMGAIERLDLGILVNVQHDGPLGRTGDTAHQSMTLATRSGSSLYLKVSVR